MTDWKRLAQHLCQRIESALDEQPDAAGYRTVTIGPSEAEYLQELVAEVIAGKDDPQ